jgi:parvulin-like peptidyl-prolyl isomerase
MVEEFEDWCFADGRQVGDTGIVKTTYGYHLIYFSSIGDQYWQTLADDAKRSEDYSNWYTEFSANYEAKSSTVGQWFTNKTIAS